MTFRQETLSVLYFSDCSLMHGIFGSEGTVALEMGLLGCGFFIAAEKTGGKRQYLQAEVETGRLSDGRFSAAGALEWSG